MELIGLGLLIVAVLGIILFMGILFTRGVFARDLTNALKRVNQQEQELQEKADILERRIHLLEQEYRAKLKRAEAEAEQLIQDAKNQAMNVRTAAIEEAKHRARQLFLEADQGRVQLRTEVAKELDGRAIRRACDSLRSLLSAQTFAALHAALMHELLDALKSLDTAAFRTGLARVVVVTSQPLAPPDVKPLTDWAAAAAGAGVPVEFQVEPSLGAGGLVQLGTTVVDNSLVNRLSHA